MDSSRYSTGTTPDDNYPDNERTQVTLLDDKHWAYLQRCYRLSPREVQVAQLICQGLNNGQIAHSLKIKQGTVKTHIRNIYRRIRVQDKISMLLKFVAQATAKTDYKPNIQLIGIDDISKKTTDGNTPQN